MTSFQGFGAGLAPVPGEIVARIGRVDRAAGQADLYRRQMPGLLDHLRDHARVESVEASSAIEGVVAPHARAAAVIRNADEVPRNRTEAELRGYSNALTYVFEEGWPEGGVSVGAILHLHRLLYEPTGLLGAGQFKSADNVVVERDDRGRRRVRFHPVPASDTPAATASLVASYADVLTRDEQHPIIAVAAFVLDFTVIHPFADGNGRVSRLLTNLLLGQHGYDVGRYVSLERQIERTQERYYAALHASTLGWHDGRHDMWPWIGYFTEVLTTIYVRFVERAEEMRSRGSKTERVRRHLEEHANRSFTMADLRSALPGISDATIKIVLKRLRDEGLVQASTGRGARWTWIGVSSAQRAATRRS
jgi:Fic family protein